MTIYIECDIHTFYDLYSVKEEAQSEKAESEKDTPSTAPASEAPVEEEPESVVEETPAVEEQVEQVQESAPQESAPASAEEAAPAAEEEPAIPPLDTKSSPGVSPRSKPYSFLNLDDSDAPNVSELPSIIIEFHKMLKHCEDLCYKKMAETPMGWDPTHLRKLLAMNDVSLI